MIASQNTPYNLDTILDMRLLGTGTLTLNSWSHSILYSINLEVLVNAL